LTRRYERRSLLTVALAHCLAAGFFEFRLYEVRLSEITNFAHGWQSAVNNHPVYGAAANPKFNAHIRQSQKLHKILLESYQEK
jgi:hypothetical protein